jgi:hypothetical protein
MFGDGLVQFLVSGDLEQLSESGPHPYWSRSTRPTP